MKHTLIVIYLVVLSGCTSLSNYCEQHPRPCVIIPEVAVFSVAAFLVVNSSSHNEIAVTQNQNKK